MQFAQDNVIFLGQSMSFERFKNEHIFHRIQHQQKTRKTIFVCSARLVQKAFALKCPTDFGLSLTASDVNFTA